MNQKQFLLLAGYKLVILGIVGMFLLGPAPSQSLLGDLFWLDDVENYSYLMVGLIALGGYYMINDKHLIKWLVVLFGFVGLVVASLGIINFGRPVPNFGITNMGVIEIAMYLVFAVWAFFVTFTPIHKKHK